jgi:hypothetical protein
VSWGARFDDPIPLANGRKLLTLQDAATHITNLPKKESDLPEWQAAIEALMLVADRGGPTMFARIGVMRALNRHVERVFDPSRKEKHWGRRNSRSMKQEAVGVVALAPSEQLAGVAHHNKRALPISRSTDLANPLASRRPASSPGSSGYPD